MVERCSGRSGFSFIIESYRRLAFTALLLEALHKKDGMEKSKICVLSLWPRNSIGCLYRYVTDRWWESRISLFRTSSLYIASAKSDKKTSNCEYNETERRSVIIDESFSKYFQQNELSLCT